jgi:outer membrane protein
MSKIFFCVIFCVFSMVTTLVKADSANGSGIAILQESLLFENSQYGKDMNKRLQTSLSAKQATLVKREEELQKKRDAFQRDELVLAEKERTDRRQELAKLQRDFQGLAEQYEMEMQDLHQSESQTFRKVIMDVVKGIAQTDKLSLVLPHNFSYYHVDSMDITNKVLEALDKRYKDSKK